MWSFSAEKFNYSTTQKNATRSDGVFYFKDAVNAT